MATYQGLRVDVDRSFAKVLQASSEVEQGIYLWTDDGRTQFDEALDEHKQLLERLDKAMQWLRQGVAWNG